MQYKKGGIHLVGETEKLGTRWYALTSVTIKANTGLIDSHETTNDDRWNTPSVSRASMDFDCHIFPLPNS